MVNEVKKLIKGFPFIKSNYEQICSDCGFITYENHAESGQCRNCFFYDVDDSLKRLKIRKEESRLIEQSFNRGLI